jgi:carbon storage regulator
MLVLARKLNQNIIIDGRIVVKIVRMDRDVVKLGIEAPTSVPVHRQEVYDEIQKSNKAAANEKRGPVPKLRDNES